jgi:hypothetical protein
LEKAEEGYAREVMRQRIFVIAQDVMRRSTLARWLMPVGYADDAAGAHQQLQSACSGWHCS